MTPDQAKLYVRHLPPTVAALMAVLNTNPEPGVKAELWPAIQQLQALMLEANAVLDQR